MFYLNNMKLQLIILINETYSLRRGNIPRSPTDNESTDISKKFNVSKTRINGNGYMKVSKLYKT